MNARLFSFVGGEIGPWRVVDMSTVVGNGLAEVMRLNIIAGAVSGVPEGAEWLLRGLTSNERYVTRLEKDQLVAKQPTLDRPQATCAALIPIRKTASWWTLAQDERRRVFEESSKHVQVGLRYLPAVARRLHHCRDLGENEPFDFLTWFEFAPSDSPAFDELVAELRASEEWAYVDRKIDIPCGARWGLTTPCTRPPNSCAVGFPPSFARRRRVKANVSPLASQSRSLHRLAFKPPRVRSRLARRGGVQVAQIAIR